MKNHRFLMTDLSVGHRLKDTRYSFEFTQNIKSVKDYAAFRLFGLTMNFTTGMSQLRFLKKYALEGKSL